MKVNLYAAIAVFLLVSCYSFSAFSHQASVTVPGVSCTGLTSSFGNVSYNKLSGYVSLDSTQSAGNIICPIPWSRLGTQDYQNQEMYNYFQIRVTDYNSTHNMTAKVYRREMDEITGSTISISNDSDSSSGTGGQTLSLSLYNSTKTHYSEYYYWATVYMTGAASSGASTSDRVWALRAGPIAFQ